MGLHHRLKRALSPAPTLSLVCVDEEGIVLDDGSGEIRPGIGKHHSAVPGNPKVIVGVDPLEVLGPRVRAGDDDAGRERGQTG
jgi:hypothetical protein